MDTLFTDIDNRAKYAVAPLAVRMRPRSLSELRGQKDAVGPGSWLALAITADALSSVILFGPAGTGKTSIARIIAETSAHYRYPLRLMSSSKASERGVGWHALGVPATRTQNAAGISQTGGERWSGAVGKICPGPARVRQIPSIVSRAGRGSLTESEEMTPQQEEKLNHLYQVCDHILEALDPIAKNAWLAAARSQANTAALEALAANSGDVNVAGKIEAAVNRALADVELGLHIKKENKQ